MVSYLITACNEHEELNRLLNQLCSKVDHESEILVLLDEPNTTEEVKTTLANFHSRIEVKKSTLSGDFASFKNSGNSYCNCPWIFQIDADEYLSDSLIESLNEILLVNQNTVDLLYVPRINIVDGISLAHIKKWNWKISAEPQIEQLFTLNRESDNYRLLNYYNLIISEEPIESSDFFQVRALTPLINFPDLQGRIYKNDPSLRWEGKVHEKIEGAKSYGVLPSQYCLIHVKSIDKQESQNSFYATL